MPAGARDQGEQAQAIALGWIELHRMGNEIARHAALAREPLEGALARFPIALFAASEAARSSAEQSLQSLDRLCRVGLSALESVEASGKDPTAPALALWREFHAARRAILALVGIC